MLLPIHLKASVSSIEVAECAELAIHKVFPDCEVVKIPVGDGGEGTVETLITAMGGEVVSCVVHDPLMSRSRPLMGYWEIIVRRLSRWRRRVALR